MIADGTAGQSRTSLVSPNATAWLAWTMGPDVVTATASNSLMEWIWADASGVDSDHQREIQAPSRHAIERTRLLVMCYPSCHAPARSGAGELGHQLERFRLVGHDGEPGDAGVGPRTVALADPADRPYEGALVAELVRHRGIRLLFPSRQVQFLDS